MSLQNRKKNTKIFRKIFSQKRNNGNKNSWKEKPEVFDVFKLVRK